MYQQVRPHTPPSVESDSDHGHVDLEDHGPEVESRPLIVDVEPPGGPGSLEAEAGNFNRSRPGSAKKKKGVKRFFEFVRSGTRSKDEAPKKKVAAELNTIKVTRARGESNAGFHGPPAGGEDDGFDGDFRPNTGTTQSLFDISQIHSMKLRNKIYADKFNTGLKPQDFQVTVSIHEARFTVANISPALCVQIGSVKKMTGEKPQEQCTYMNEYFVFEFNMQPALFMDQLINLTVYRSKKVLGKNEILGCFKLDVGTVYSQPDHQFFRKWAILTNDEAPGVKGHLKCTITVCAKGDAAKQGLAPANDEEESNIEENLLLPVNMSTTRQQARYILSVHVAEGVPMHSGYVEVFFAGHSGRTAVARGTPKLAWNESLVFTEMFPPLVRRIRVQVFSGTTIVATHFLDIGLISDDREDGFLPTFGPSFVNLYGSIVTETSGDKTTAHNEGLIEGSAYKGRLLLGLELEILDESTVVPLGVTNESCDALDHETHEEKNEFLLFACIMDCSMLDKRLMNKRIHLEMSIGHSGHSGLGTSIDENLTGRRASDFQGIFAHPYKNHSTTNPLEPEMTNKKYCSLPYGDNKPCLSVHSQLPDFRWRLYHANFLHKVANKAETALNDIRVLIDYNREHAEREFDRALDVFYADCCEYQNYLATLPPILAQNSLDHERFRLCGREITEVIEAIDILKLDKRNYLDDKLQMSLGLVLRIRELSYTPQDALPDVFIWLMQDNKRIAYHRLQAKDVIFSLMTKERGSVCSKINSFHLRMPGKRSDDDALSRIQGQVTASFWLGLNEERCDLLEGMPKGYNLTSDVVNINENHVSPPYHLEYVEKYQFELRCHIYQAKCLLALDDSGLSDPFCRIVFNGKSVCSQVLHQTLNPTWNETLVLSEVTLYGTAEHLQNYPPTVVVEVMDEDVSDEDFMGQVIAQPAVKLVSDAYEKPYFPPELQWFPVHKGSDHGGEVLAAFELLQLELGGIERWVLPTDVPDLPEPKKNQAGNIAISIPENISPELELYRIEVLFWSLRDLQRINLMTVEKPRVDVECGGFVINSDVISNYSKSPKFKNMVKSMDIQLPVNPVYWPAITIRCIDFRSFGRGTLVGSTIIRKLDTFLIKPEDVGKDPNALPLDADMSSLLPDGNTVGVLLEPQVSVMSFGDGSQLSPRTVNGYQEIGLGSSPKPARSTIAKSTITARSGGAATIIQTKSEQQAKKDEPEMDWWTKYYASLNALLADARSKQEKRRFKTKKKRKRKHKRENQDVGEMAAKALRYFKTKAHLMEEDDLMPFHYVAKHEDKTPVTHLKIYTNDLEYQEEFEEFADWVKTYSLFRGQRTASIEEQKKIGKFKGYIKICKHPLPEIFRHAGLFTSIPSNEALPVLVRVYVVKADDLRPTDANRKSDPYLYLMLGKTKINDKENYIPNQLNPVFAKCFEINTTFPVDSQLCVQVYDKDLFNKDDLIGETHIDLENRFYSKHKGTCGFAEKYEIAGYNAWRDSFKPSVLLTRLCNTHKLVGPHYGQGQVQVGRKIFIPPLDAFTDANPENKHATEDLALYALRHWEEVPGVGTPLVPEHVEMRSLYHPQRPGIIQGKLEMWVDMFTLDAVPKPAVDITAREPKTFELRVTIWNTDDVILEEMNYITGEKMSDIYVKGWLNGPDEDEQQTDVHYRSLTGEGNFNWRFVFPFQYLEAEEKLVIKKKSSLFALDEEELKMIPTLELQVWDADVISKDDFLGSLPLNLTSIPRGAKSAKKCDVDILDPDSGMPTINLFRQRRLKGWWPFLTQNEFGEQILAGKVEAEFQLVSGEEAEKSPVGLGRDEPHPLPAPKRPDTSFTFFMNPLKSVRYFLGYYKWKICKVVTIILVILFFALFIYNLPGYLVKKMLNA